MKIFPVTVRKTVVVSGGGTNPPGSSVLSEGTVGIKAYASYGEASGAQADSSAANISGVFSDTSSTPTEAITAAPKGAPFADTGATPSELKSAAIRYWATAASDNDSSKTTPANATGPNNGTVATVKTGLGGVTDTVNPVTLTLGSFGVPTTLAPTQKLLRIYFQVTAAPGSDTVTIKYTAGAASGTLFTASAAVNNLASGVTYDLSALTMAQLNALSVTVNYQALLVVSPSASIAVDAAAVELIGVF